MENRGYFVMDQREEAAKDSECLENDPPYMEIKVCYILATYCSLGLNVLLVRQIIQFVHFQQKKTDPKDNVVLTDPRATWKKISKPVRGNDTIY